MLVCDNRTPTIDKIINIIASIMVAWNNSFSNPRLARNTEVEAPKRPISWLLTCSKIARTKATATMP